MGTSRRRSKRALLGAHMSIAGGLDKALSRARDVGCTAVQIFLRPNLNWRARPLTDDAARAFAAARKTTGIRAVVAHGCYLVNPASTDRTTRARSLKTLTDELCRAERLRLPSLIIHPGAHLGAGERAGLRRIARGIDRALRDSGTREVRLLLETTAGAGTVLGHRFEQLAEIIALSAFPERLAVCYDTCHAFAAGYDLRTRKAYRETMRTFDRVVGLDRLQCFHLNDAKRELGSRRDRHAHIGCGEIGEAGFGFIMKDRRFARVPKIIETPKTACGQRPWDEINLETLRRLADDAEIA